MQVGPERPTSWGLPCEAPIPQGAMQISFDGTVISIDASQLFANGLWYDGHCYQLFMLGTADDEFDWDAKEISPKFWLGMEFFRCVISFYRSEVLLC